MSLYISRSTCTISSNSNTVAIEEFLRIISILDNPKNKLKLYVNVVAFSYTENSYVDKDSNF